MRPHWSGAAAFAALASLSLTSCTPWTVRPIEKQSQDSGQGGPFHAGRYVDSIWDSKVLPAVSHGAIDWKEVLRSGDHSGGAVLVKGEARVVRGDTNSRTGLLLIGVEPYDGRADAAVAIGPAIRGTALRDALPFIQFSQFINQLQFAQVANALNDRVVAALGSLPAGRLEGSTVVFSGAAEWPSEGGLLEIVPVTLTVKWERQ